MRTTKDKEVLDEFAKAFPFCFVCYSRQDLQIHHMAQGPDDSTCDSTRTTLCQLHERLISFLVKGLSKDKCCSCAP